MLEQNQSPPAPDQHSHVEKFDLVIQGTGLTESILAAAAAWAGKKVLHFDKNTFYGSHWAALSLEQIDAWAQENAGKDSFPYNSARLFRKPISTLTHPSPLQASRSYSLDLAPHLLYCSSDLVSCLTNTRLSQYLEFKALDHIFILQKGLDEEVALQKVPSSREDVFTSSLPLQEKRRLMKFLNYALNVENVDEITGSLNDLLSSPEYNLPLHLRTTIQYALTLSPTPDISATTAIHAIRRHLTGFGLFGTFPVIVPLHGGGGELSQAFCRAAAVKGATYILGRDIESIKPLQEDEYPLALNFQVEDSAELSTIRSKSIILPATVNTSDCIPITRSISVVEDIFEPLFLPGTLYKDAALIVIPPGTLRPEQQLPVQVILHGGGTGECPVGQWVIYCSIQQTGDAALEDLTLAEKLILQSVSGQKEEVQRLLRLTYHCLTPKSSHKQVDENGIRYLHPPTGSIDYDDAYHEARKLFAEIFGVEEAFLPPDLENEVDVDAE